MRNYGVGKNLDNLVIRKIAEHVSIARGNGTASENKIVSDLQDLAGFMRSEYQIRNLEKVTQEQYAAYADNLRMELENGEKESSTTSSYISAINSVFEVYGNDNYVSAKEYGIARGHRYDNVNKSVSNEVYQMVLNELRERFVETADIRYQALAHSITLQREGGLRFRESTQIKIECKDFSDNMVRLERGDGVKNGQPRTFTVREIAAFQHAQEFVRQHAGWFTRGSLIPSNMNYSQYRNFAYSVLRSVNESIGSTRWFHAFRHSFAHESYTSKWEEMTGREVKCPVEVGKFGNEWREYAASETGLSKEQVRELDKEIRLAVGEELGHHRIDITNAYLGGHHGR
ncbi:MAG: tyrosine-type recombinase/integrase [Syntrophales bacterium]|jgi:site-specific recombinase XerD